MSDVRLAAYNVIAEWAEARSLVAQTFLYDGEPIAYMDEGLRLIIAEHRHAVKSLNVYCYDDYVRVQGCRANGDDCLMSENWEWQYSDPNCFDWVFEMASAYFIHNSTIAGELWYPSNSSQPYDEGQDGATALQRQMGAVLAVNDQHD